MQWDAIVALIRELRLKARVKPRGSPPPPEWTTFLIVPTRSYVESSGCGPVPFREVEWIEIDPVRITERGRLVPPAVENLAGELLSRLTALGVQVQGGEGAKVRVMGSEPDARPAE
ncbi:DUF6678 family protein [Lysobacter enzymogenes]|uniref:Uncharacterized protein n=1 Tax=Lysobacter enzymogenes TaxID=69 RepID=A0A3N2RPK7_LYSEN|nr:DUF6678 family protein [Lysobacter enzymogenes]ROU09296.1 hypothetical protein D9T17_00230 [Lysobacter enzymogenes]